MVTLGKITIVSYLEHTNQNILRSGLEVVQNEKILGKPSTHNHLVSFQSLRE